MFSSESEVFTSSALFLTLPKKTTMSSGEYALTEVFGNGTFVESLAREGKNAPEEAFSNGSPVKSLLLEEDEVVSEEVFPNGSFVESVEIGEEDVFTNGSLPTSLSSAPLLPLYQIVVRQDFHTSLIVNFLHIFGRLIKATKQ